MMKRVMFSLLIGIYAPLISNDTSSRHVISFPKKSRHKTITIRLSNENNNAHVITQYNSTDIPVTQTVQQTPTSSVSPQNNGPFWSIMPWCKNHKSVLVVGALGIAGVSLWAVIQYLEYLLEHHKGWSSWHADYSCQQLVSQDQQQAARELFAAIKTRYLPSTYTSMNFLDPLVSFVRDCDAELASLNSIKGFIKKCAFIKTTSKLQAMMAACHEKSERIRYFKKLSVRWLSEYNLDAQVARAG